MFDRILVILESSIFLLATVRYIVVQTVTFVHISLAWICMSFWVFMAGFSCQTTYTKLTYTPVAKWAMALPITEKCIHVFTLLLWGLSYYISGYICTDVHCDFWVW